MEKPKYKIGDVVKTDLDNLFNIFIILYDTKIKEYIYLDSYDIGLYRIIKESDILYKLN